MSRDGAARACRACRARRAAAGTAIALALLASCAAPLKVERGVDSLSLLPPGALAYAHLDGAAARALAPSLLGPATARQAGPALARASSVSLAFLAGRASLDSTPAFEAVLLGDYPFRATALALAADPAWRREGTGFAHRATGIRAAAPGPGIVAAASGDLVPLLARIASPGSSPLPSRLASLAGAEMVAWLPEPFSGLASRLLGEELDIPASGLLLAARRELSPAPAAGAAAPPAAGAGSYELTVAFLMPDADSARIFRPALRLAWYGIARSISGPGDGNLLAARFSLDGELCWASVSGVDGASLAAALGATLGLAGALAPDGPPSSGP